MRYTLFNSIACFYLTSLSQASEVNTSALSSATIAALSSVNLKVDQIVARNHLNTPHLKGEFGEALTEKLYLNRASINNAHWRSVTPRFGRQGIDQLYIKYDSRGRPRDLIVCEVKYGSSQLGQTADGKQMSDLWVRRRLGRLSAQYTSAQSSPDIRIKNRSTSVKAPAHEIPVQLNNGKKVTFWRNSNRDLWNFEGVQEDLKRAKSHLKIEADYLQAASTGAIRYRSRLSRVIIKNNTLHIDMLELDSNGSKLTKPPINSFKVHLKAQGGKLVRKTLQQEIAKQISTKKIHWSVSDCSDLAKQITKDKSISSLLNTQKRSLHSAVFKTSIAGGAGASLLTLLIDPSTYDSDASTVWTKGALSFGSTALGVSGGSYSTQLMLNSPKVYQLSSSRLLRVGLSRSMSRTLLGSSATGAIATALYSYGEVAFGITELGEANRHAAAGLTGIGASAITFGSIVAAPSLLGATAGSGVAISSLSGAAASNASLAVLGGGTAASGGGGMAAGMMVATGGAAVAGVVIVAGVYYSYQLYDENEEDKRIQLMADEILTNDTFRKHISRRQLTK